MSRAYDPYDNAYAEPLWAGSPGGRLKAELAMPKGGYESLETPIAPTTPVLQRYRQPKT